MAIETDQGLLIIHAMKLRSKYRSQMKRRYLVSKRNTQPVAISSSGTPITDEAIEQLNKEAEVGYDLTQARQVGRRSLAGGSGKSPRLGFRTTPELYELAAAKAEQEGKTVSQLAREALEQLVTK